MTDDCRRNTYYFWNRKTNVTTWDNPLVGQNASAASAASATEPTASTSKSASANNNDDDDKDEEDDAAGNNDGVDPAVRKKARQEAAAASKAAPTATEPPSAAAADYGGIDPELAYLDPSLAAGSRRGASASGAYAARFNARTGRFEGDPTKNPERVGDVERAKRQNQFYFDYDNWQKTLAAEHDKRALDGVDEDGGAGKRQKLTKKQLAEARARNAEKKEKKRKAWLLES